MGRVTTITRLALRSGRYFLAANLAIMAGVATATAVLVGALLVGDSVRGSLRDLAVARLGPVDHALIANRFFPADLAARVAADPRFGPDFSRCAAALILRGGARVEPAGAVAGGAQILASDALVPIESGAAMFNLALAIALGTNPHTLGSSPVDLRLSLPQPQASPLDAPLARRSRADTLAALRVRGDRVAPARSFAGSFDLTPSQRLPRNIWVNLADLQRALDASGRINTLLVTASTEAQAAEFAQRLDEILQRVATLDDYGLRIRAAGAEEAVLESSSTYIAPAAERAAERVAARMGIALRKVSVYLADHLTHEALDRPRAMHYVTVAGISSLPDGAVERPLGDDEIAINEWAAKDLKATVGDSVRLSYQARRPNGDLAMETAPRAFRVARILPMSGLGADPSLTPDYPGLTDADTVADWNPPQGMSIDKSLVTQRDEDYWNAYRAAPRAFVSLPTARALWGRSFGELTSLRVPADRAGAFAAALRDEIDPAGMGLRFEPIHARQIAAAEAGTDFSELFLGLSFFILAGALMLSAMLVRLGVERRARQLGLLAAVGFSPKRLLAVALIEGSLLALIGSILGMALGVGYTAMMLHGLRTWWIGAVGTRDLSLHVSAASVAGGWIAGLLIALLATTWGVWRVGRVPPARLLSGGFALRRGPRSRIRGAGAVSSTWIGTALLICGLALAVAPAAGLLPPQVAGLSAGAALLAGGLILYARWLSRMPRRGVATSIESLALRNAARHRSRAVLTTGLVAFASFVLVLVASMRQTPEPNAPEPGAGGYDLILTADIPLLGDPRTPEGRELLGLEDSPALDRSRLMPLRTWRGDDASCLNLTQPRTPTIVAVSSDFVHRGGFAFADDGGAESPWTLLDRPGPTPDDVPVIADAETAAYILKLSIGQSIAITDSQGTSRRLRLAATLEPGIFQGVLLMGERDFHRLFTLEAGFGMMLIDTGGLDPSSVARRLSSDLDDYAVTVESTHERLQAYRRVANTYLSTFQALGSLGLLVGTLGLLAVMLRGLFERRAELALLAALGFAPIRRQRLILVENAALLVFGLAIGTLSALAGVLPALASGRAIHLVPVLATLGGILIIGLGLLALAAHWATSFSPADLRAE